MKLNYKRTIIVGLAFMSICAFWQVYDGIIPKMLSNTFSLSESLIGKVMAIDNILALFMLPLFGSLSDRTNTKIGRRMPFILGGTFVAVTCLILIPIANTKANFALFFVALGLVLVAMATYRSPAVALMPDVTPKPLRSQGNAVINFMGALGGALMLGLISFLVPKGDNPNYMPLFAATAGIMAVCVIVLALCVNEPKTVARMRSESREMGVDEEDETDENGQVVNSKLEPAVRRSLIFILLTIFLFFMGYNSVSTFFSLYCENVFGLTGGTYATVLLVATVSSIIAYVPVGYIASKIGRKRTILIGTALLAAAFGLASFVRQLTAVVYGVFVLAGIGYAFIIVNTLVMVVEMSKGSNIGKYTGLYYTFSMAAQIITPMISGRVLQSLGYEYLFPYAVLFGGLSFVTMLFVRHGDSKPQPPRTALESFDVED